MRGAAVRGVVSCLYVWLYAACTCDSQGSPPNPGARCSAGLGRAGKRWGVLLSWAGARCGLFRLPKDTSPKVTIIISVGLYLEFLGLHGGLYRTIPEEPMKMTTVSHLYGVVRGVVQSHRAKACTNECFSFLLVRGLYGCCTGICLIVSSVASINVM